MVYSIKYFILGMLKKPQCFLLEHKDNTIELHNQNKVLEFGLHLYKQSQFQYQCCSLVAPLLA